MKQSKAGKITYAEETDILVFKIKKIPYHHSIEFQNYVIDISKDQTLSGIRILGASETLNIDKKELKHIKAATLKSIKEDSTLTVQLGLILGGTQLSKINQNLTIENDELKNSAVEVRT